MKTSELTRIIKRVIMEEFESNSDHIQSLATDYLDSKAKLAEFLAEFGHIIIQHNELSGAEKKKATQLEKMMKKFNIIKHVADKMVFEIVTLPKYKVLRPDYKEVFETALSKLNAATQRIINDITQLQLTKKSAETTDSLKISKLNELESSETLSTLDDIESGLRAFATAAKQIQQLQKSKI